jgi:MFS family permease
MEDQDSSNPRLQKGYLKWLYPTIPVNIIVGPLSTLMTLYIIQLGGGILQVALAITLYNAVTIPSALFWGKIVDIVNRRRCFILLTNASVVVTMLALFYVHTVSAAISIYAVSSFFVAAGATPLSLMVMETQYKTEWSKGFAKLQLFSSLGSTLGYILSYAVTAVFSLSVLILVFLAISLVAVALSLILIYETSIPYSKAYVTKNFASLFGNMVAMPRKVTRKAIASNLKNYITIFYFACFVFWTGSYLLNTEFPVSLSHSGFSSSEIFLLFAMGMVVQTLAFYYYDRISQKRSKFNVVKRSLILRGIGYVVIALALIFMTGILLFGTELAAYSLSAGIAYPLYYISSNILLFALISGSGRSRGSSLGVYTSLTGLGMVTGAILSGYITQYFSYWLSFMLAGLVMFFGYYLFTRLDKYLCLL